MLANGGSVGNFVDDFVVFYQVRVGLRLERAAFDALATLATPLGRYSTAEEMATLVLFLLRDAPTVTGAALVADGGYTL
jgi:NAD(P)-dependent dehydrogenase (short-subunit alcohol dehydrogenase family)